MGCIFRLDHGCENGKWYLGEYFGYLADKKFKYSIVILAGSPAQISLQSPRHYRWTKAKQQKHAFAA